MTYKGMDEFSTEQQTFTGSRKLRGNRNNVKWFIKLHRRLIKPPYPTMLHCPNCGGPLIEVNSDMVEVSNDPGMPKQQLTAKDAWSRIKHYKCGAMIVLYWKD